VRGTRGLGAHTFIADGEAGRVGSTTKVVGGRPGVDLEACPRPTCIAFCAESSSWPFSAPSPLATQASPDRTSARAV